MKTRTGYVSNSSSSSFILEDNELGITAGDFSEFVKDQMPEYRKKLKESLGNESEYGCQPDPHPVFCSFDLRNPLQRREAIFILWGDFEDSMNMNGAMHEDGTVTRCYMSSFDRSAVHEMMDELWEYKYDDGFILDPEIYSIFGAMRRKNAALRSGNQENGERRPLPDRLCSKILAKMRANGYCDCLDTLLAPNASIAVYFDENEIHDINGMWQASKKSGATREFSFQRFFELFAKWMVKRGRLPKGTKWEAIFKLAIMYNIHMG